MVFDSRFNEIREHFRIQDPEDWQSVRPEFVLSLPNIGPQTLNHLRLHLANQGLTLQGDQSPAYWQSHLNVMRGTSQIADSQSAILTPFTVLIDKAEQLPFMFEGFRGDAHQDNRPLIVQTESKHLGATHGDYSLAGLEHHVHIERKSRQDVQSTVLGWGERREQFQRTLAFLAGCPSSAIVIECTRGQAITTIEARGKKSKAENQKIFQRQVAAWEDDYRVPWKFCDNRRLAEIECFRQLERQWKHVQADRKRANIQSQNAAPELTGI